MYLGEIEVCRALRGSYVEIAVPIDGVYDLEFKIGVNRMKPNVPDPEGFLYLVRGTGRRRLRLQLKFGVIG